MTEGLKDKEPESSVANLAVANETEKDCRR